MRTHLQVAAATAVFALVHSGLASLSAKEAAGKRLRHGRQLYRVLYNAQAVVTFGALTWFIGSRPKKTLYQIRGPVAGAMRVGQLSGILLAVAAARATGVARLAGIDNLIAVVTGTESHPPPAAQGPEIDEQTAALSAGGPFQLTRHPLNLAPLAPFWLTPHMTTRRLAFNVVASIYLVIGSRHEERRLSAQYGERYEQYRRSGVPFYVPRPRAMRVAGSERTATL